MAIFTFDGVAGQFITGTGFNLAPDLTWPSSKASNVGYKTLNINPSAGLTTAISLVDKWVISAITFDPAVTETYTVKLTVDGVVIWNDSGVSATTNGCALLGAAAINGTPNDTTFGEPIVCNSSFLLELQSTTDTNCNVHYIARPIL